MVTYFYYLSKFTEGLEKMTDTIAVITIIGFIIGIIIQLVSVGIFIGVYKTTISFMQKQIEEIKSQAKEDKEELKTDMRKYNNVLERIAVNERDTKSAHHRIDELELRP